MTLVNKLNKIVLKASKKFPHLQVYIDSNQLSQPFVYSPQGNHQAFHSASVGKLATTMATLRLIQKKKLAFDTRIDSILSDHLLDHLFVYQGVDYRQEVTVTHLLSHMSGINDYFEGLTKDNTSILDDVLKHPDHFFTPESLILYTSHQQNAVGKPGEKFLYSDTGFVLLAFILEAVTQKKFYQILQEEVFEPLSMQNTGLLFYDPNVKQDNLAPVIVRKIDIRLYKSLSIDYSGGGLVTTLEDLSKLVRGLFNREFITKQTYDHITQFEHHFTSGMFYGLGLMEIRFEKMFFLLKGLPRLQGHLGVLGVHAWIDPVTQDVYVMNVSNMNQMVKSFNILISCVMALKTSK